MKKIQLCNERSSSLSFLTKCHQLAGMVSEDHGHYGTGSAHNGRLISPKIRHFHPRLPSYEDDDGVYHHVKNKGHNRRSNGHVKSSKPKSPKDNLVALHFKYDQSRRRFVEWAQNEIAVVPDFRKRILFSDEAHFWLNGYVNKQNCRIWSEANPQVYVETPLYPEKLTVWCALWAGGILL
ncbi:hypothetical protein TNCV_2249561 [Trichonephila clavipes]|nr:hypothetical protein TNCV_2249561 [Trichonephila clavipes]